MNNLSRVLFSCRTRGQLPHAQLHIAWAMAALLWPLMAYGSIETTSITYATEAGVLTANVAYPGGLGVGDTRPVVVMLPGWNGSGDVAAPHSRFWTQQGYVTLAIGFKDLGGWNSNIAESAAQALTALFADPTIPSNVRAVALDGISYGGAQSVQMAQALKASFAIKAVLTEAAGYAWPGTCTSTDHGATCPDNGNATTTGVNLATAPYSLAMIQNKDDATFPIDSCAWTNCGTRNRANFHANHRHAYSECSGTGGHGARTAAWNAWRVNAMKTMFHQDHGVATFPGYVEPAANVGNGCRNMLRVKGKSITDYQAKPIVLRGVNFAGYWLYDVANPEIALTMIDEVKKTGANAVRLVWQGNHEFGRDAGVLDTMLGRLVADHMIAIPELHASADGTWMTCSGINSGAVQKAGNYWKSRAVLKVLKKYEGKIILNIANEVGSFRDNPATLTQDFINAYTPVIRTLRKAGLRSPFMIDAPNCGQAGETLAHAATALLKADPLHNLVFSVHTYWGSGNYTARLNGLVTAFGKKSLTVGEFSQAQDCVLTAPANDYQSVLDVAHARNIGYLAWNWGGGQDFDSHGAPCPADNRGPGYSRLGMTDRSGAFANVAGWGQIVADDIQSSSVRPNIFP